MSYRAAVIGLGKLGSCLAASLANGGITVGGVDIVDGRVSKINDGVAPFPEPDLQAYIDDSGDRLSATTKHRQAVANSDVTFVMVNTLYEGADGYALRHVNEVAESIGEALATIDDYHLIVLRSTVMPGSTGGEFRSTIEEVSGKRAGEDFGLCYCPEFTAVGEVIEKMEHPDFFLIGEHDERAGECLSEIYRSWVDDPSPVIRTDLVSAEVAKLAINSYVSMKISFANTLAQICDGMGGDVDEVTDVLAEDFRISGNYLTAGTRYGGPCFPQDNGSFGDLAVRAGTRAPLARAADEVNERHSDWIADVIRSVTPPGGTVAILGMTYKPGVAMVTGSEGMALARRLDAEFGLICYDPMGIDEARQNLAADVNYCDSLEKALDAVDTAVVTVQWDEFEDPDPFRRRNVSLVDPWRIFDRDEFEDPVEHVSVGQGDPR
ncbi:hypothetical protein BRD00_13170 [Halobacteriales archaeon QS_8_69_26]|nr:MAG: hypothetical protein BRD00_13170 [Halobacteriales archaeon QS_8_69_26]